MRVGDYRIQVPALLCVCSVTQSCQNLCNPIDCSLSSSSIHGILQARILEWVAIFFSRGSSQPRDQTRLLCFLHWQASSLPLCHLGSLPALLETVFSLECLFLSQNQHQRTSHCLWERGRAAMWKVSKMMMTNAKLVKAAFEKVSGSQQKRSPIYGSRSSTSAWDQ